MQVPKLDYDIILFDEAQDANRNTTANKMDNGENTVFIRMGILLKMASSVKSNRIF